MLELHHLIKAYPGKGRALDDVSFALPRGERIISNAAVACDG